MPLAATARWAAAGLLLMAASAVIPVSSGPIYGILSTAAETGICECDAEWEFHGATFRGCLLVASPAWCVTTTACKSSEWSATLSKQIITCDSDTLMNDVHETHPYQPTYSLNQKSGTFELEGRSRGLFEQRVITTQNYAMRGSRNAGGSALNSTLVSLLIVLGVGIVLGLVWIAAKQVKEYTTHHAMEHSYENSPQMCVDDTLSRPLLSARKLHAVDHLLQKLHKLDTGSNVAPTLEEQTQANLAILERQKTLKQPVSDASWPFRT
jgi:hypothetical protein